MKGCKSFFELYHLGPFITGTLKCLYQLVLWQYVMIKTLLATYTCYNTNTCKYSFLIVTRLIFIWEINTNYSLHTRYVSILGKKGSYAATGNTFSQALLGSKNMFPLMCCFLYIQQVYTSNKIYKHIFFKFYFQRN